MEVRRAGVRGVRDCKQRIMRLQHIDSTGCMALVHTGAQNLHSMVCTLAAPCIELCAGAVCTACRHAL